MNNNSWFVFSKWEADLIAGILLNQGMDIMCVGLWICKSAVWFNSTLDLSLYYSNKPNICNQRCLFGIWPILLAFNNLKGLRTMLLSFNSFYQISLWNGYRNLTAVKLLIISIVLKQSTSTCNFTCLEQLLAWTTWKMFKASINFFELFPLLHENIQQLFLEW